VNPIYANLRLSGRETEVMRLLGDGKTTAEIAAKLKISLKTVNEYCARLKQKMSVAKPQPSHTNRSFVARAGVVEIVFKAIRGE
jgi:DNA-binding NarL/FixJ family response regulator